MPGTQHHRQNGLAKHIWLSCWGRCAGLDARAANIVMRCVKSIVQTGRTIVSTIHQPSIDIFEQFDELVLLKRGGETIYCGPLGTHSKDLIAYFEVFTPRYLAQTRVESRVIDCI